MLARRKKKILELAQSLRQMLGLIPRMTDCRVAWEDSEMACVCMLEELVEEKENVDRCKAYLIALQTRIARCKMGKKSDEEECRSLQEMADAFIQSFGQDIRSQISVVFFPYKYSMWDSLESIYLAAKEDPDCIVKVVPIPYHQYGKEQASFCYEGGDFPGDIPITHYSEYSLEEDNPDIVFVHNIYDQHNTLTRVHADYYTANLKKHSKMLVFVPYHISTFMEPLPGELRLAYHIPSIANVDKVVVAGKAMQKAAIRDGVSSDKVLALGSPKFDALFNDRHPGAGYLKAFKEQLEGKKVFLINTGCMNFTMKPPSMRLVALTKLFTIPLFAENAVVVWRPHPLSRVSVEKYSPAFLSDYDAFVEKLRNDRSFFPGVYIDEDADYVQALDRADVLISADGSLLRSFVATGKPILYWGSSMPEHSMLPSEAFYYLGDPKNHWTIQVRDLASGKDDQREKRKGAARGVYENIDGTCGVKVWNSVKQSLMERATL